MEVSRRTFLASTIVGQDCILRRVWNPPLQVSCTLDESRSAFHALQPLTPGRPPGTVLVESSAGLAAEDLTWLGAHGITLGPPQRVPGPAWVRYSWPVPVMIRDFSRARRVSGGRVIARLGDLPVAVCRGSFIVLGSPLGPHVYAGDRDARHLLEAILRSSL